jgi:hypothetical protein
MDEYMLFLWYSFGRPNLNTKTCMHLLEHEGFVVVQISFHACVLEIQENCLPIFEVGMWSLP